MTHSLWISKTIASLSPLSVWSIWQLQAKGGNYVLSLVLVMLPLFYSKSKCPSALLSILVSRQIRPHTSPSCFACSTVASRSYPRAPTTANFLTNDSTFSFIGVAIFGATLTASSCRAVVQQDVPLSLQRCSDQSTPALSTLLSV